MTQLRFRGHAKAVNSNKTSVIFFIKGIRETNIISEFRINLMYFLRIEYRNWAIRSDRFQYKLES